MKDATRTEASGAAQARVPFTPPEPFHGLLENLPAAAYTCDAEGLITYFNSRAATIWGRDPKLNNPVDRFCGSFKLFAADGAPMAHDRCWMALALLHDRPYLNCEVTIAQPSGHRVPAIAFAQPVHDADGRLQGAVNVLVDLSERLELERTLNRVERDNADLFENGALGIHWVDAEGIVIRANRAELELFGYEHDEYVGHHISEFHADQDVIDDILTRLAGGDTLHGREVRMRCRDGSIKHVALSSNVLWEGGRFIHTRCFTTDITAQKAAEQALREADARKDEFLAVLAHELRNPLAPIVNAVEYLRREGPVDSGLNHARDIIDRQVVQMSRLVDDLLDVARITRGNLPISTETISAETIVKCALEVAQPLVDDGQHQVRIDIQREPLHVEADLVRMSQVLSNLVNNAARYTEPGGTIDVHVRARPSANGAAEMVELSVSDNGIGLSTEDVERVFDMFVQAERRPGRSRNGLGLGLTLARSIVEMHGGSLEAHSAGPGQGSTFTVRLPRVAPPSEVAATDTGELEEQAPRRVLIVDDHVDSAVIMGRLLTAEGHDTRVAHDGSSALEAAEEFEPEVLLLDIGLPDIDGYEVCQRVRKRPWAKNAVIIAISGWGQEDDKDKAQAAGFDAHLTKPAEVDHVRQLLAR